MQVVFDSIEHAIRCSHVSGLELQHFYLLLAGMEIRGSGPNHYLGLDAPGLVLVFPIQSH